MKEQNGHEGNEKVCGCRRRESRKIVDIMRYGGDGEKNTMYTMGA